MPTALKELAQIVRAEILPLQGVTRFTPNRRFSSLYSEGSPADSVYFLDSGLVKTCKRGAESKEVTIEIILPGQVFGLQALVPDRHRQVSAEILHEGSIFVIPREVLVQFCGGRGEVWRLLAEALLLSNRELEKRIGLLCLQDVQYRILHFVAELAETIGSGGDGRDRIVPLSQGELASLVGATRETTSTILNDLARVGLLRLGRRQLMVPSLDSVRAAADQRASRVAPQA